MNDDQILLYTIAEILLEVSLSEEKKQRIRDAMCMPQEPVKAKSTRFVPPTQQEVEAHFSELKVLNAPKHSSEFYFFYESKGWMVGKNKMKSWKSAASRWAINLDKGDTGKRIIV